MFALYDESINMDRFIDFMQRVIDSSQKKVYLIVDNLRVHHAKLVKTWIEEHKEQIALFYLPPYSPEFNPDEYLNQDYKRNANKNKIPLYAYKAATTGVIPLKIISMKASKRQHERLSNCVYG